MRKKKIIGRSLCIQVTFSSCRCKRKVKLVLFQRPALANSVVALCNFVFTVVWAQVPYFPCGPAMKNWCSHSSDPDCTHGVDHFGETAEGRLLSGAYSLPKATCTDVGCYKAGGLLTTLLSVNCKMALGNGYYLPRKL